MEKTPVERVALGAALLDGKKPDWFKEIDTDTLDVGHSDTCILAQLSGCNDYSIGAREILCVNACKEDEKKFLERHGFTCLKMKAVDDFKKLDAAWRVELDTRLLAA